MFSNLTEENIILYCMKAYDKPSRSMSEFEEDIKRIKYLNRLFSRYMKYGNIKENLVLNHLVILYNVFGVEAGTRILFYRIHEDHYSILKTFLVFLSVMPDVVKGIRGNDIVSSDILLDQNVVRILRNLLYNK